VALPAAPEPDVGKSEQLIGDATVILLGEAGREFRARGPREGAGLFDKLCFRRFDFRPINQT
jgi:hypothetical protein